jgi:hypothetical protein
MESNNTEDMLQHHTLHKNKYRSNLISVAERKK